MHTHVVIYNKYSECEIAVFKNKKLCDKQSIHAHDTSKLLILTINNLLLAHAVTLASLQCIIINQGPGPFSTLRSVIATVNGLHCATNIPIIGIDSLKATLSEYKNNKNRTIVLLNAFNNEVYFAIEQTNNDPLTGYKKLETLVSEIAQDYPHEKFSFIGNGTMLYRNEIIENLKNNALISEEIPEICSLEYFSSLGLEQFENSTRSFDYLLPLYLKKHPVELK